MQDGHTLPKAPQAEGCQGVLESWPVETTSARAPLPAGRTAAPSWSSEDRGPRTALPACSLVAFTADCHGNPGPNPEGFSQSHRKHPGGGWRGHRLFPDLSRCRDRPDSAGGGDRGGAGADGAGSGVTGAGSGVTV